MVAALLLASLGCSSAPTGASVEVLCDEFYENKAISREAEIAVDGSLEVTLCSNPSTGFKWETATISDASVLEQVEHKLVLKESATPPPPGIPGVEVWTLKGVKQGESTVSIAYS